MLVLIRLENTILCRPRAVMAKILCMADSGRHLAPGVACKCAYSAGGGLDATTGLHTVF